MFQKLYEIEQIDLSLQMSVLQPRGWESQLNINVQHSSQHPTVKVSN